MEREDKRGIFFGVIGVLTLIVAIIGASLAYFSINANSRTDALTVQAATVQIVYEDGDELSVSGIIPSTKSVAQETYRRYLAGETYSKDLGDGETTDVPYEECIDDNGYTVCGVYEFTLTNNGVNPVDITAKVIPSSNTVTTTTTNEEGEEVETTTTYTEFQNLKYSLYDVTGVTGTESGTEIVKDGTIAYSEFQILTDAVTIGGNGTQKRYRLFIWLDEQGEANNAEQGAVFKGTVYINVPGAENITGTAAGY